MDMVNPRRFAANHGASAPVPAITVDVSVKNNGFRYVFKEEGANLPGVLPFNILTGNFTRTSLKAPPKPNANGNDYKVVGSITPPKKP